MCVCVSVCQVRDAALEALDDVFAAPLFMRKDNLQFASALVKLGSDV